jgi:hypothetical protein
MTRTYSACLSKIPNRGVPPTEFLDQILDTIISLPDDVFAPNDNQDIYSLMYPRLGPENGDPWTDLVNRRAAMLEILRVDAGFESSWNWNEGADTTAGPETPEQQETGAWQVSADSLGSDSSLSDCLDRLAGAHDPSTFITAMKSNHALAVEYAARLFRFSTRWSGPCNTGMVYRAVSRDAMAEFQSFLTLPI